MPSLINSAFRAFGSLFVPGMLGTLVVCVLVTILSLVFFVIGASAGFIWLFENSWFAWAGSIGSGILAWFLFPGIMPVIVNFFDARIAGLIERHEYPNGLPATEPPFWPELWHDARFTLIALSLNLLALPLYLIVPLNVFVFYLLNGYLLGREFFVMVARRHMPIAEANALRKRHGRVVLFAGVALAFAATVPIVNLFAPFWGIALMTHLYHSIAPTSKMEILPPQ